MKNLDDEPCAADPIEHQIDNRTEPETVLDALFEQTFESLRLLRERINILKTIVNDPQSRSPLTARYYSPADE